MRWPWNPPAYSPRDSSTPLPRPWWRRNWPVLAVVLAIILGVGVWRWHPWNPCDAGLQSDGRVCAGLDVGNSGFTSNDPLRDLEKKIHDNNHEITGPNFITIVYLDDIEPDQNNDSVTMNIIRHSIEGAITAQHVVNETNIVGRTTPKIRLLLANYGSYASDYGTAVTQIHTNQSSQHIVAVTGVGESLKGTRQAIAGLSNSGITTVSSVASGKDMNQALPGNKLPRFFRVTSTNNDESRAAVSYIGKHYSGANKVLLVQDTNPNDDYATNLGDEFAQNLGQSYPKLELRKIAYQSDGQPGNRPVDTNTQFSDKFAAICDYAPDLIYFAGRGIDLRPFLKAFQRGGLGCLEDLVVLSGDDFTNAAYNQPLPTVQGTNISVIYTAVATGGEWSFVPDDKVDAAGYKEFSDRFSGSFNNRDLIDGHAIMEYDAFLTTAQAARKDPDVGTYPSRLVKDFSDFDCDYPRSYLVPGAGGQIAFYRNTVNARDGRGNPIDKPVPIMEFRQDGTVYQKDMEWSDGRPFYTECGRPVTH